LRQDNRGWMQEAGARGQDQLQTQPGQNGPDEARRHRLRGRSRVSNVRWRDVKIDR